jgi:hypothetical protein
MIETLALLVVLATTARLAHAEEPEDPRWNLAGWTPSLTLGLGVHVTPMEGSILATNSAGNAIRLPQDTEHTMVTPLARISLGVESPELPVIPGHIRLFGSADYFVSFPPDVDVASEGSPTGFVVPPGFVNPPSAAIEGQGSQLAVEMNRHAYGLTGGISIPIDIGEFRFHIKPGVSWMRQQWDIKGLVLDAEKNGFAISRDFRGIELRARGKLYSSGVGPYLAVDTAPDSWGPVLVSAFVEAAYYRTIGETEANITASKTYVGASLPPDTYLARWGLEIDEYFWRAGIGIRVYLAAE